MPTDFTSRYRSTISASANAIASSIDHVAGVRRVNRSRQRAHRAGADVVEAEIVRRRGNSGSRRTRRPGRAIRSQRAARLARGLPPATLLTRAF